MSGIQLVSTNASNQEPDGQSDLGYIGNGGAPDSPSVFSPDGSKIVFTTSAHNIAGATTGVVIKDLTTGAVSAINVAGAVNAENARFTADGSKVTFGASVASGNNSSYQAFETNLATGQTTQLTSSGAGASSSPIGVSPDGSKVAVSTTSFTDSANPEGSFGGPFTQTFSVANVGTGQTVPIGDSTSSLVTATPNWSEAVYITNTNNRGNDPAPEQLYAENTTTGATKLVSGDAAGNAGNANSDGAAITPAGDKVVFTSDATNLLASAPAGGIFIKDLSTNALSLIAANQGSPKTFNGGGGSNSGTENDLLGISTDGSRIGVEVTTYNETTATDGTVSGTGSSRLEIVTPGGSITNVTPTLSDAYSYNSSSNNGSYYSSDNGDGIGQAAFSPDGTKIAYVEYSASNFSSTYTSGSAGGPGTQSFSGALTSQVYIFDLTTGTTTPVAGTTTTNSASTSAYLTDVYFSPDSSKLAVQQYDPSNQSGSVLVTDLASGAQLNVPVGGSTLNFSPDGSKVAFASSENQVNPASNSTQREVFVEPVCFTSGTLIRTARGDVAVEDLAVGDLVVTAAGERRPVKWLGHRTLDCRHNAAARPVCIAAHAFGPDRPARDLRVSPGHAICVDVCGEVLVPATCLVNGATVAHVAVEAVTYWHVELDSHDVLLAENLPCESYLEMGNRGFFAEAGVVALDALPDAAPDLPARGHADFCRPLHLDGPVVDAIRLQLRRRAFGLGWSLEERPLAGLHLLADGRRIEPATRDGSVRFAVPAGVRDVWLMSDTSRPCDTGPGADARDLGVCLAALLTVDGFTPPRTVRLDDERLGEGFHAVEAGGAWRWTAGRARLPASLFEGSPEGCFLCLDLERPALPRWLASAAERSGSDAARAA